MTANSWKTAGLALAVALAASGASGVMCTIEPTPAATLLLPHFSVELAQCGSPQANTLFSVVNPFADPALAHVTVWTNLGVPVAGFDLYLQGYDRQVIDVNALVCDGVVPVTGETTSPAGAFSGLPTGFPGCSDPVAASLDTAEIASLRAYLDGSPSPSTGLCAALPTGLAEGYLTVDVTSACTALDPSDPTYYAGILAFDNVLVGEYQLIDPVNNFAQGFEAVHIEADPFAFAPGNVTFYGRYNGTLASDAREPLGTTYRAPYDVSQATSSRTDLIVWRESDAFAEPFACGSAPPWYPLRQGAFVAFSDLDVEGLGGLPPHGRFELATQRRTLEQGDIRMHPASAETGWLFLRLQNWHTEYAPLRLVGQAWVSVIRTQEGRFSTGMHAVQLDSACSPGSISYTSPGRATVDPGP